MKIHPSVVTTSMVHLSQRQLKSGRERPSGATQRLAAAEPFRAGVVGFGSGMKVAV